MPIYEFVCQQCGHEFERIQSFSDVSTPECPHCAAVEVNRQVSRPAIHFKGSGWYITDSKEKGKKPSKEAANGNSTETGADGGADGSADGGADATAKPETASKDGGAKSSSNGAADKKTSAPATAEKK